MTGPSSEAWDDAAATFDEPADHGLGDPGVRLAWALLLSRVLPSSPSRIADVGCGTGSLTILAAELGHEVDGIDFSEQMLTLARDKAAGRKNITFALGDAGDPPLAEGAYDAVMCRHVLWAVSDAAAALNAWSRLLRPRGRLILIEGRWSTGAGLSSEEIAAMLRQCGFEPTIELLDDDSYWGAPITDQRYLVTGRAREAWADHRGSTFR